MKKKMMNFFWSQFNYVLTQLGRVINQNLSEEELKHSRPVKSSPRAPWRKKTSSVKKQTLKTRGRQGKRNKDAEYFNHPRKDISSGRANN
jgi:hypothetical protein